jgi:DNA-binding GntR family transcriptional regulator
MSVTPLKRETTVDALVQALRTRILDGDLAPGTPLREQHLSDDYQVSRHTLRAALRALEAEGLVRIEPHRGARVTRLDEDELHALAELRIALEREAARLALRRHGGRLPGAVHAAQRRLEAAVGADVAEAHEALHHAIVEAAGSPRIEAAHRALGGELRLFLVQLRPAWDLAALAAEHQQLLDGIERDGPGVLRAHIEASTEALVAWSRQTPQA